jgi:hypothetical protein
MPSLRYAKRTRTPKCDFDTCSSRAQPRCSAVLVQQIQRLCNKNHESSCEKDVLGPVTIHSACVGRSEGSQTGWSYRMGREYIPEEVQNPGFQWISTLLD